MSFSTYLSEELIAQPGKCLRIPLVNLSFVFFLSSSGGSANFDIVGYSAER